MSDLVRLRPAASAGRRETYGSRHRATPRARPTPTPVSRPGYGDDAFFPAPPALAEFVLCLWRRRYPADVETLVQPTLPDGCIDVVSVNGCPAYAMGPETVRVDHPVRGGTEIIGVRLRPGVGARLFGAVAAELSDAGALLSDLPGAPRYLPGTRHTLELPSAAHRPLVDALLPRIAGAGPDDGVAYGAAWLARHPAASIDDLCVRLGWSPREVRRRFTLALGFGPKLMQRMLRFQRVLALAQRARGGADATLSRLAAACGYADQAHMTREFRALAFVTPRELLRGPFDATLPPLLERPPGHAG
ncbi:MAG: helix-turn-helix transcriptional regulator [Gemmatimonadetes bacterium]|nr:helix-turn-helix transcriptional regulator [Gemmatimonadota bacterium]